MLPTRYARLEKREKKLSCVFMLLIFFSGGAKPSSKRNFRRKTRKNSADYELFFLSCAAPRQIHIRCEESSVATKGVFGRSASLLRKIKHMGTYLHLHKKIRRARKSTYKICIFSQLRSKTIIFFDVEKGKEKIEKFDSTQASKFSSLCGCSEEEEEEE